MTQCVKHNYQNIPFFLSKKGTDENVTNHLGSLGFIQTLIDNFVGMLAWTMLKNQCLILGK